MRFNFAFDEEALGAEDGMGGYGEGLALDDVLDWVFADYELIAGWNRDRVKARCAGLDLLEGFNLYLWLEGDLRGPILEVCRVS